LYAFIKRWNQVERLACPHAAVPRMSRCASMPQPLPHTRGSWLPFWTVIPHLRFVGCDAPCGSQVAPLFRGGPGQRGQRCPHLPSHTLLPRQFGACPHRITPCLYMIVHLVLPPSIQHPPQQQLSRLQPLAGWVWEAPPGQVWTDPFPPGWDNTRTCPHTTAPGHFCVSLWWVAPCPSACLPMPPHITFLALGLFLGLDIAVY